MPVAKSNGEEWMANLPLQELLEIPNTSQNGTKSMRTRSLQRVISQRHRSMKAFNLCSLGVTVSMTA